MRVPANPLAQSSPDSIQPDETSLAIAAAIEKEQAGLRQRNPDEPPLYKIQKEFIEAKRWFNDLKLTPRPPELTPSEAETIPGRRIR